MYGYGYQYSAILKSGGGAAFVGLLDDYPTAAAAYSLRKLRNAYSGNAIRVRRSSDNAESNIGFVNNELDTASLTTFCSGTNGFVTTWYDQSGNGINATQTTAANQPQIVASGVILLENGKPKLQTKLTDFLLIPLNFAALTNYKIFTVIKANLNFQALFGTLSNTDYYLASNSGSTSITVNSNSTIIEGNINGVSYTPTTRGDLSTRIANQSLVYTDGSFSFVGSLPRLSYQGGTTIGMYQNQELVIYLSTTSNNVTNVMNEINDYYGIY